MDIYEAIDEMERMYDMHADITEDSDLESFANALEVIYQFARKYQPNTKLPDEWTCTCGAHLWRSGEMAGMSQFICPHCDAEWLIGPQEVD